MTVMDTMPAPPGTDGGRPEFAATHARSESLWAEANQVQAGGVSHTNRRTYPYPIYYERAKGARKWDVDGNEYVDYNLNSGSLMLGHAHPEVVRALHNRVERSTPTMCHPDEIAWAKLVQELIPCAELVRFMASGTESTKIGMRAARAFTRRDTVVRLEGHFHGWHDYVMRGYREPFTQSATAGVPEPVADTVRLAPLTDIVGGVERLLKDRDVALVILEPSGPTWGTVPLSFETLAELRRLCDEYATLLMFDEVITGFRYSPGGVQAASGVTPDLTSLGKALTGGMPGGALVGRADIMDAFRPGRSAEEPYVLHFSTFTGHPMTASAGLVTLQQIRTGEPNRTADAYAGRLRAGIQDAIDDLSIRGIAYGDASMFHVYLESLEVQRREAFGLDTVSPYDLLAMPSAIYDALQFQLRMRGVDLVAFNGGFASAAHGEAELDLTLEAFGGALRALRDDGAIATV